MSTTCTSISADRLEQTEQLQSGEKLRFYVDLKNARGKAYAARCLPLDETGAAG